MTCLGLRGDSWCCAELNSPSKQRPHVPSPLWLSQQWRWISSISAFLLFYPLCVLILSLLVVKFQPGQAKCTWFVPCFWVSVSASLHVYTWECMNCLCIVCVGSYCRFMMMGVNFLPSCFKRSQLWSQMEDWCAPLNYKQIFSHDWHFLV